MFFYDGDQKNIVARSKWLEKYINSFSFCKLLHNFLERNRYVHGWVSTPLRIWKGNFDIVFRLFTLNRFIDHDLCHNDEMGAISVVELIIPVLPYLAFISLNKIINWVFLFFIIQKQDIVQIKNSTRDFYPKKINNSTKD